MRLQKCRMTLHIFTKDESGRMKAITVAAALFSLCAAFLPLTASAQADREEERVTLTTEDGWNLGAR